MSSSDSASTEESSGHSGKVRRLLLLDNEQDDERGGRRGAKTQTASDQSKISMYLGIHMMCRLITKSSFSHSAVWLRTNLLLSVRLLVSSSDEGPLLVFAISIAIFTSSIHLSISTKELEEKTHKWTEC